MYDLLDTAVVLLCVLLDHVSCSKRSFIDSSGSSNLLFLRCH